MRTAALSPDELAAFEARVEASAARIRANWPLDCLGKNFANLRFAIGMERAVAERTPGFTYVKQAAKLEAMRAGVVMRAGYGRRR